MRWLSLLLLFVVNEAFSQQSPWKDYSINDKGDTMNRIDIYDRKQGPWTHRVDKVRGEPGYEEEGWYVNNRKDGEWRLFSLVGDLVGVENYKWGFKDGLCKYYTIHGELKLEQSWKALNPDKEYDTLEIEDPDKLDTYRTVIIKNEGAAIKHGIWKYYDTETGSLLKSESYMLGALEAQAKTAVAKTGDKKGVPKPKEVLDFEKKNKGKKVKYQDGSVGN